MIFVTVGAQMPFDRLVTAVDGWACRRGRRDVFAQIGPARCRPRFIRCTEFLDPPAFHQAMGEAELIVAHAGMGSILTALELGKPILVMPRLGALRETRNDHQVATARRFRALGHVAVAFDEEELVDTLDGGGLVVPERISDRASKQLIDALSAFARGQDAASVLGQP